MSGYMYMVFNTSLFSPTLIPQVLHMTHLVLNVCDTKMFLKLYYIENQFKHVIRKNITHLQLTPW